MAEKQQNNETKTMTVYQYNEAVEEAKKYFKGDDLAATVWVSKYALKDSRGNLYEKSPEQMHQRIASEIERIEKRYPNPMSADQVYDLLKEFRYLIPQGGPMTGIGNNLQIASLSNCFVIGHRHPADSYGGIIRIDEEQVQLMKRRGGVGHDLSHIRPTGSPVLNSALTSTGIVPFMERYSNSTREVAQDGRRGALMLSLSIKHPDAENFIDAKVETGKVTGANVSIKIDDEFMQTVIKGGKYHQQFPIDSKNPLYEKDIDAKALWEKIVHNAWKSAEPGILFWDTVLRESIPDCYADLGFRTVSTNPCGEIPLCPYDSCRLLAINLYGYVDKPFTAEASFNFDKFKKHVVAAMRMMDDIIDLELEKIETIIKSIYLSVITTGQTTGAFNIELYIFARAKNTPPIMERRYVFMERYFRAVNDKQLGICLRMLYAEQLDPFVKVVLNEKDKIEFHIRINADEQLYDELIERYKILIS